MAEAPSPMSVVPTSPKDAAPNAMILTSRAIKLPFCARFLVMRRVNHFNKIAIFAAAFTLVFAAVKFYLAVETERDTRRESLENTGVTVAKTLRTQMSSDLATLDSIANVWHLDSTLSRVAFRKFVLSDYFKEHLNSMQTVILVHRVLEAAREQYETEPTAVQVKKDCCETTVYDVPSEGLLCRATAKNQCNIKEYEVINGTSTSIDRFYITAAFPDPETGENVVKKAGNASDHLVVYYQEPLELNPGPTGFDLGSMSSRKSGFLEAEATGRKGITQRVLRVFAAVPQFGMLVWNNVYVDKDMYGSIPILDGVELSSKQRLEALGKTPYAIGSVVARYELQTMLENSLSKVFNREISRTKVVLFDTRESTPKEQQLLAVYASWLTSEEMGRTAQDMADSTLESFTGDDVQVNSFEVQGASGRFTVLLIPEDDFFSISNGPYYILMISIALVIVAQVERWMGHPWVVSQHSLVRKAIEDDLRAEMERRVNAVTTGGAKVAWQ